MSSPPWFEDLVSRTVQLLPVRPVHSAYIYALRNDANLSVHLSLAPVSEQAQREWIGRYMEREWAGTEFYFIITRKDGTPCGTVRLYNFCDDSFSWGSWILDTNKTRFASIESLLLVYRIGFEHLSFRKSHFYAHRNNAKAIRFYDRFGARRVTTDDANVYFELTAASLEKQLPSLLEVISGPCSDHA